MNDSGIESSDEEDIFITQIATLKMLESPPQTPQKASQPASTDSGISMSYDAHAESCAGDIEDREPPESPLTGKSKSKRAETNTQLTRPGPNPIQPMSLSIRTKGDNYSPFEDKLKKMRKYISEPWGSGKTDLKKGYIYAFQLDGCAYTKIGKSAIRKAKTPEGSIVKRIKEHKGERGHGIRIVLGKPVPFVGRIENLIKFHLAAGRMREKCSCKGSKGQPLNHGNHIEWFSNSLDEIWTVAIAWQHWILSSPYVKLDAKSYALSPEWEGYLKDIRVFQTDRDVWLDWLSQHVPDVRKVLIKNGVESSEEVGDQSTAEVRASFVRSNAAGTKSEIKRARTNLL